MIDELAIGPCMAVELAVKVPPDHCGPTCPVETFRKRVGPADPVIETVLLLITFFMKF